MNKKLQKNPSTLHSHPRRIALLAIIVMVSLLSVQLHSIAQGWPGPTSPPTEMSEISSIVDIDDLISLTTADEQKTSGGVRFGTEIGFSGGASFIDSDHELSLGNTHAGLIASGVEGADVAYLPPLPWASSSGIVGHAGGGEKNYGLLSVTNDGIALFGRADAPLGYGGYFNGDVSIEDSPEAAAAGSLSLSGALSGGASLEAIPTSGYAIQLTQTAPFNALALSGVALGAGIGIHGHSNGSSGIVATSTDDAAALDAFSETSYGLYGYSGYGTGIIGEAKGSAANAIGVYGKGYDKGVYGRSDFSVEGYEFVVGAAVGDYIKAASGVGIMACGTQYAATFGGNVRTLGALGMGIEEDTYIETDYINGNSDIIGRAVTPDLALNETSLLSLYTLCQAAHICNTAVPSPSL